MPNEEYELRLRPLVEEYQVAIKLGQHQRAFQLSLAVGDYLVEILDDDLEEHSETEPTTSERDDFEPEIEFVGALCGRIKSQARLASIYDKVLEFVNLRDLVCLSKLVGAIENNDQEVDSIRFDFDRTARTLRQAVKLLKFINSRPDAGERANGRVWLRGDVVQRSSPLTGLPKYFVVTEEAAFSAEKKHEDLGTLLVALDRKYSHPTATHKEPTKSRVATLVRSGWFVQFLRTALLGGDPHPALDRFTLLVAILMIGIDCRHRACVQLAYELIDQVHHEEANSGSIEDLMLLTQAGSIWLSHHKRHRPTMKLSVKLQANELDDYELADDEPDSSSSSRSSLAPPPPEATTGTAGESYHQMGELRAKMRRLIDDELLYGRPCAFCDHVGTELLGPLKSSGSGECSECGLEASGAGLRCAISHQPLGILTLNSVRQLNPSRLVILTPSEWVRELVAARGILHPGKGTTDFQVSEQVDISEKFERLTMIRGPRRGSNHSPPDNSDDSPTDENSDVDSDEASEAKPPTVGRKGANDYLSVLRDFMKSRPTNYPSTAGGGGSNLSESLLMLRFLRAAKRDEGQPERPAWLPLCSSDLLVLPDNEGGSSAKLGLARSTRDLLASGSLWQCASRSAVSGLPVGCGQSFCSLELIRCQATTTTTTTTTGGDGYKCPLCQRHLSQILTLAESLADSP